MKRRISGRIYGWNRRILTDGIYVQNVFRTCSERVPNFVILDQNYLYSKQSQPLPFFPHKTEQNKRRHERDDRENFSKKFENFLKFSGVFGSFWKFGDVFGPVRTCPDAFGCDRMHLDAFGRSRLCHVPANP